MAKKRTGMRSVYINDDDPCLTPDFADVSMPINDPHQKVFPGERKLMRAVLFQAFDDLAKYRYATTTQGKRLFREANKWLVSRNRKWPYSFENICESLQIDLGYIRRLMRQNHTDVLRSSTHSMSMRTIIHG